MFLGGYGAALGNHCPDWGLTLTQDAFVPLMCGAGPCCESPSFAFCLFRHSPPSVPAKPACLQSWCCSSACVSSLWLPRLLSFPKWSFVSEGVSVYPSSDQRLPSATCPRHWPSEGSCSHRHGSSTAQFKWKGMQTNSQLFFSCFPQSTKVTDIWLFRFREDP